MLNSIVLIKVSMKNFNAGRYINQGHYQSFQPNPINRKWQLDDMKVLNLLSQADRQLGRLDMYSEYIPNIDLFISMQIETITTQGSIDTAFLQESIIKPFVPSFLVRLMMQLVK